MVFAVDSPMLRVWPHGTLASAGRLEACGTAASSRLAVAVSVGGHPSRDVEGYLLKAHNSLAYQR